MPTCSKISEVQKIGLKYEQLLSQIGGLRGKATSAEQIAWWKSPIID